ncbi:MAG: hypothetical protein ABW252_09755 [Polyangiales bacterium]
MQRALLLLLIVGALGAQATSASAQARGPRLHAGVGFALDFGGDVEFDDRSDIDLDPTVGLRGHLDYAVHRHVSVGGLARLSWWEPDAPFGQDRSFLFDLGPRVIGHFDYRDFRFYSGLSLGVTISVLNDDWATFDNPGVGPTLTVTVVGAEWWFGRRTGLFAELGWVGHWFEHDLELSNREVDLSLSQGLFEFGLVFGG